MNIERRDPFERNAKVWVLTIDDGDLDRMRLNAHDRMILDDCQSADATVADTLLGLELVARRIEESHSQTGPAS